MTCFAVMMIALNLACGAVAQAKTKTAKINKVVTEALAPEENGKNATAPVPMLTPQATPAPSPTATPTLSVKKGDTSHLPAWKAKPELYRKVINERAVIVSSLKEEVKNEPGMITFTLRGGGLVSAPKGFCFRTAQNFERLKDVSDHFRTVSYDPANQKLFLIVEALGYQARMMMRMTPVSEDWRSELQWEVIWGTFKGMKGVVAFEAYSSDKTEVSLTTEFKAIDLPLPKPLRGFVLEVITQKIAERMRTYLEQEARRGTP